MNIITFIILATLVIDLALHFAADYLNLKNLGATLPESFKGVYDEENYRKSQKYFKTNTRFGWGVSLFDTTVLLAFWFGKGFPWLNQWVKSFHLGPVFTGLLFIGALAAGKGILSLPFSLYHTFVIEERFGFNKTSPATYIKDLVKVILLSVLLGGPILALIIALFQYAGDWAWFLCWMATTAYMLIVQFIAPTWIMPLFNKFTPLEEGELKEAIMDYARSIDFDLENVYIMDGSKRSSKSNAFFTGFGKNKRIALFDTLVERHTVSELVAVLAHEMGHYKKRHIIKGLILSIVHSGIMFYLLSWFLESRLLFEAFFMEEKTIYAGLIFFGMLYSSIDFILGIFLQMFSRKNEYEADRFAVQTTRDPRSLAEALKKLSVNNLSNLFPHPFYVFLNYSHPPVIKRIETIQSYDENKAWQKSG